MRLSWKWRRRLRIERNFGKPRPWRDGTGRWYLTFDVTNFAFPYLRIHGEGEDSSHIALGYGHPGSDPAVHLEVDLEGTRLGRWIAWTGWRRRQAAYWLRKARRG